MRTSAETEEELAEHGNRTHLLCHLYDRICQARVGVS